MNFDPFGLKNALYDKGCITCGRTNIFVTHYQDRHICLECRKSIISYERDPMKIFLDDEKEHRIPSSVSQGWILHQIAYDLRFSVKSTRHK